MGFQPFRYVFFARKSKSAADKGKQLPSAAILIAIRLIAFYHCNQQRNKKAQQPKPCKQDIKKSQNQINQRCNPKEIVPFLVLFHSATSSNVMTLAGHSFAQSPQPTHSSLLTPAQIPFGMVIAFRGQTFMQQPQATHCFVLTLAFRFAIVMFLLCFYSCIFKNKGIYNHYNGSLRILPYFAAKSILCLIFTP